MISIIVAMDKNNAIGYNNQLLCRLKKDMEMFREFTMGKTVVMGRKTFQSIGKPLQGRDNIVLSRNAHLFSSQDGVLALNNVENVLKLSNKYPSKEFVICGGSEIYKEFLPHATTIYLTEIHNSFERADSFFPSINKSQWKEVASKDFEADEFNDYGFTVKILKKIM